MPPTETRTGPFEPDQQARNTFIYWYELVKRPGWRNRRVESVSYKGDCQYEYRVSFDINYKEFDDRLANLLSLNGQEETPDTVYLPLCELDKSQQLYDFDSSSEARSSLPLLQRIICNEIMLGILTGCICKYQDMQQVYRSLDDQNDSDKAIKEHLDISYSGLIPSDDIIFPSKRMFQIFSQIISFNRRVNTKSSKDILGLEGIYDSNEYLFQVIEYMFSQFDGTDPQMDPLSAYERKAWETLKSLPEFVHILYVFANNWLPFVTVDYRNMNENKIIKLRYRVVRNLYDADPDFSISKFSRYRREGFELKNQYEKLRQDIPDACTLIGQKSTESDSKEKEALAAFICSMINERDSVEKKLILNTKRKRKLLRHAIYRIFLSIIIAIFFGPYLLISNYSGWIVSSLTVLVGVLFYVFLSRDFIYGIPFFFGHKFEISLDRIGSAETEHIMITAPEGMEFSPILDNWRSRIINFIPGFFSWLHDKGKLEEPFLSLLNKSIKFFYITDGIDEREKQYQPEAIATGSITTAHVALRTYKGWNQSDPWNLLSKKSGKSEKGNARYRRIPYQSHDRHKYVLFAWLRPKVGKRGLGYMFMPLLSIVALCFVNVVILLSDTEAISNTNLLLSIIALVAPYVSITLSTQEDEPFIRKSFLRLPRSFWKLAIAVDAIGLLIVFFFINLWDSFLCVSLVVLGIISLVSFIWYFCHHQYNKWTRDEEAFQSFPVEFVRLKN